MSIYPILDSIVSYLNNKSNDNSFLSTNFIAIRDKEKNIYYDYNLCIEYLNKIRTNGIIEISYELEDSHALLFYKMNDINYIMKLKFDDLGINSIVEEVFYPDLKTTVLEIEYDGTNYYGMQKQDNSMPTIQGEIEKALKYILKEDIIVYISSRTDRGVHAKGQTVHFYNTVLPPENFKYALNTVLPKDVRVINAYNRSQLFNSRYDVVKKEYNYVIDMGDYDLFRNNYVYFTKVNNISKLREELKSLEGTHDFVAFCKGEKDDTIRTIYEASLHLDNNKLILKFVGSGFLHNMIRLIVGSLLDIDKNNHTSLKSLIESKDKNQTNKLAPASGLYLMKIYY